MPLSRRPPAARETNGCERLRRRALASLAAFAFLFGVGVGTAIAQPPAGDEGRAAGHSEDDSRPAHGRGRGAPAPISSGAGQSRAADAEDARGGWVVAAFVGGAATHDSRLSISQPALGNQLDFDGVRFDGRSFEPPLYYGLRGGYFLRSRPEIGFETEFIHL